MIIKEKYRDFCKTEINLPIFSRDWWLDAVCGKDNWDVVLVEKGGKIWASLPYYKKRRLCFNIICMPMLTQTMGIYIKYPEKQKYYKKLSWEKEIIHEVVRKLPKFDSFVQNFNYSFTNWLPFYWNNFEQTTRYTYRIDKNIQLEILEKEFETDVRRRRRRRAMEKGVSIVEIDNIEIFDELNKMTFLRQNIQRRYNFDFLNSLYRACKEHNSVKVLYAKYKNEFIAASFLVYDDCNVYYLMGGLHPDFTDIGGMDLVQTESIKFALKSERNFDFEGSMIENIEKYFRSFGAIQVPYFCISKVNSKIMKIKKLVRAILV